jgi:hypothetical protein
MDHHPFINFNMITYLINQVIHHTSRHLISLPFSWELIHFIVIIIFIGLIDFNILINFSCLVIIDLHLIHFLIIIHHPIITLILVLVITLHQYHSIPSNYLKFPFIKFYQQSFPKVLSYVNKLMINIVVMLIHLI